MTSDVGHHLPRGATLVAWLEAIPGVCLIVSLVRGLSDIHSRRGSG